MQEPNARQSTYSGAPYLGRFFIAIIIGYDNSNYTAKYFYAGKII